MIKILFSTYFYHSNLAQKHVFMFFCKGHKHSLVYLSSQCSLKKNNFVLFQVIMHHLRLPALLLILLALLRCVTMAPGHR